MKKNLLIALIAAAALAPAAHAQNYVGASAGKAEQKLDVTGIGSVKESDTAYKLYGGHQFNKHVGIEAGYTHFGTAEAGTGSSKANAIYVAATGTLPLTDTFALIGKAGIANTRTTFSTAGLEDKYRETKPMIGVGATLAITPTALAVIEYEAFGKTVDEDGYNVKSNVLTAGVRFSF